MLILTRKRNESIRIGDNIVVRVMRTANGSVKIGIEAPDSVRILRGELSDPDNLVSVASGNTNLDDRTALEVCNSDALLLQH
jgi:carbon storage regulator